MDPEKQPLLNPVRHDIRHRRFRMLTSEEVQDYRHNASWRRTRFCFIVMFWSLIAMCLSVITCILINTPKCNSIDTNLDKVPTVPPVHLSFAPLIFSGRNNGQVV